MFAHDAEAVVKEAFHALNLPLDLQDAPKRSIEDWETVYAAAFGQYETGNYEEAASFFTQLVLSNPYSERYWFGLASCMQMQKKYNESLPAWAMCALLNEKNPLIHFHAAECLLSLNEKEEAIKALNSALKLLTTDESSLELRNKIELLKKLHL
jgi:type III secretion system low calcium response chaperone LcrH/SycD